MNLRITIVKFATTIIVIFYALCCFSQEHGRGFKIFEIDDLDSLRFIKPLRISQVLCSRTGLHKFISNYGLIRSKGMEVEMVLYSGPDHNKKMTRNFLGEDSVRAIFEGSNKVVFFATHDNKILWLPSDEGGWGYSPFYFPPKDHSEIVVSSIWIDRTNNLYIGTRSNSFYFIKQGGIMENYNGGLDNSGNFIITEGEKHVQQISLFPNTGVFCFAEQSNDDDKILLGTNKGIFRFNKSTGRIEHLFQIQKGASPLTITRLDTDTQGKVWFSSLEKGMASFQESTRKVNYFPSGVNDNPTYYPISTFCRKTNTEFFVAVLDSVPAIFNTISGKYQFIHDPIFKKTNDSTTDIKVDGFGNLFVAKGGGLYYTNYYKESKAFSSSPVDTSAYAPFISEILVNGVPYLEEGLPKGLKSINLNHNQNSITINFSIAEFLESRNVRFAWLAEGYLNDWVVLPVTGQLPAFLNKLNPGKYVFRVKARVGNEDWRPQQAELLIIIKRPIWQTSLFWALVILGISIVVYLLVKSKIRMVRKQERTRAQHEKELLEMEARALRAQMNPHFIFNCLNSIKALIQNRDHERATEYLTTFSKLIRTLFQNSDKRQISLHDEIETCRLYTQLEAMRLNGKLKYQFDIDTNVDLKSLMVPALIIQPFIENAIWHGIVPKESGTVKLTVKGDDNVIICQVDDDGIGRELSKTNRPVTQFTHESKGLNLSLARVNLEKLLNETQAFIETIDLYENDISTGTRVIITFHIN